MTIKEILELANNPAIEIIQWLMILLIIIALFQQNQKIMGILEMMKDWIVRRNKKRVGRFNRKDKQEL